MGVVDGADVRMGCAVDCARCPIERLLYRAVPALI